MMTVPIPARRSWVVAAMLGLSAMSPAAGEPPVYRSPYDLAYSPDGKWLAVSDRTAGAAVLIDPAQKKAARELKLNGRPMGVAWDGGKLYVAEYDAGSVAEIAAASGKVLRRIPVGPKPVGVAVVTNKNALLATEFGLHSVVVVNLGTGKESRRIPAVYAPMFLAVTPDESMAVVANSLPFGDATSSTQACAVTLMDLAKMEKIADIVLPPGCVNLREIAISPDSKWAYLVHTVGRYTLPTTQLERGWINSNGLTILDLAARTPYATLLLDQLSSGASDPWGIALAPDGGKAWISLAGTHQMAEIALSDLHLLMEGKAPKPLMQRAGVATIWQEIQKNPARREELQNDLAALYAAGLSRRTPLPGNGPRGVAVSPDGRQVAVAMYFSGDVLLLDAQGAARPVAIPIGKQPEADALRRGETAFHDATLCFQNWLSCATCHPDGRADGLNWDLLNDGIGNPKNTKSMVWAARTPPAMSLGVRATADLATEKGFHFIQFHVVEEGTLQDVRAYIGSLEPERSPHLVNGKLSPMAEKGRKVFESPKVGCAACHPAPLFTDLKMHDVGTSGAMDKGEKRFDNPTCIEMWRTSPFLHDGAAATLLDMLTVRNRENRHGKTSKLSKEDLDAVVEYLLSQ